MTKSKLKQITLDSIQHFVEENRDEILDIISVDAIDIDEDGETVPVEHDFIEEVYDAVVASLF